MKSRRSIIFMFAGQGSQYYHMGAELFLHDSTFRNWMRRLDRIARELTGGSIIKILYNPNKRKMDLFTRTLYTSPAIFMVQFALAMTLMERGIGPDAVLGVSLGEFVAAAVAGIMSPEEVLNAAVQQALIFEKECEHGGMLAILHQQKFYEENNLIKKAGELSSVNFDSHFVVSASTKNIWLIKRYLKQQNVIYQELPVRYPFHSSLIDPVRQTYLSFLSTLKYEQPQIPIITCTGGGTLKRFKRSHFWDIVREKIVFAETIRGLEQESDYLYIDLCPTGTLASFVNHNLKPLSQSGSLALINPFQRGFQNLDKTIKACNMS